MKFDAVTIAHLIDKEGNVQTTPVLALSKRELFAAMALQGILSCPDLRNLGNREACVLAISYADQLLERLGTGDGFTEVKYS